jgi:predicted nucleic acid-binding protein
VRWIVLDASVALAWSLDRPIPAYAEHIERLLLNGVRALVPALWHLELANGFVVAERRRLLTSSQIIEALRYLDVVIAQGIESSGDSFSVRAVLSVAREFSLTAYDAVYLETAVRQGLPLATLDRVLAVAAGKAGVEVVQQRI